MPYAGMVFTELLKALKAGTRLAQPATCIDEMLVIIIEIRSFQ